MVWSSVTINGLPGAIYIYIYKLDQMVIMLSFSLSKEGVLRVYIVKIWNMDITGRYNIVTLQSL